MISQQKLIFDFNYIVVITMVSHHIFEDLDLNLSLEMELLLASNNLECHNLVAFMVFDFNNLAK